ncbi:MAG TPA: hypothetical protein VHR72_00745 [Gemmataceae bacterium]|jgi:hypothetical protein|nr:hypothetical protein [Gemmataceae bacterium]
MIPDFRDDGFLPEGLHLATESEVIARFGERNSHRRRLAPRVQRWLELAREIGARRFMIDGSFVTAKEHPNDVDAVVLLPEDFQTQLSDGDAAALEINAMIGSGRPKEIMAAYDEVDWETWLEIFSRTREQDDRLKGVMEIEL